MRPGCALLMARLSLRSRGRSQRGGGMRGGGMPGGGGPAGSRPGYPSPMPNPGQRPGWGGRGSGNNFGNSWRWNRNPRVTIFNWAYQPWLDPYGCAPSPFPSYWSDACNMYSNPGGYPGGYPGGDPGGYPGGYPDMGAFPSMSMAPPQPYPPPEPPINFESQPAPSPTPVLPSAANGRAAGEPPNASQSTGPSRDPVEGYSALIVFKAGGMYSASNYWVKNKRLYFNNTQGETLYAPLSEVERLYPAQPGRNAR